MREKRFQTRSFVSLLVAVSFVLLTATGLVLYVVPSGRVANWMEWQLLFLDKDSWGRIHTVLGFVFLIGGPFHLAFNWKPFRNYLATRWAAHLRPRRELLAASLLALLLTAGAIADAPPVSYITALGSLAKDSWTADTDLALPPGKPDEMTLEGLAARIGIDPDKARSALAEAGIRSDDPAATLATIAAANRVSPRTLFELASRGAAGSTAPAGESAGATHGGGSGLGQKTVADVADSNGVSPETALARLDAAGIDSSGEEQLRDLAERAGVSPVDLTAIIRGQRN